MKARVSFLYPTDFVSMLVGDRGGDSDPIRLEAFDTSGSLLGFTLITVPAGNDDAHVLSYTSAAVDIAYVEWWKTDQLASNNSIMWDDFSYNLGIPEPASMLLLGSGLVGLAGLGRRKFRKKS